MVTDTFAKYNGVLDGVALKPLAYAPALHIDVFNGIFVLPTTAPFDMDKDRDGFNVCLDCNDNDPSIHPGAGEICNDGKDNNCNGLVDCADPSCSTDPACCTIIASLSGSKDKFTPGAGEWVVFQGDISSAKPFSWDFSIEGNTISGDSASFSFEWDGKNADGRILPPGIYVGRLTTKTDDSKCSDSASYAVRILPPPCKLNHPWESSLNIASGNISHSQEIFSLRGGSLPLHLSVFFQNLSAYAGPFGRGWSHNYDIYLREDADGNVSLRQGLDGRGYVRQADGTYQGMARDFSILTKSESGYTLTQTDGRILRFDALGRILAIENRFGETITFTYPDPARTIVRDSLGREITFHLRTDVTRPIQLPNGDSVEEYYMVDRISVPGASAAEYTFIYHPDGNLWKMIFPQTSSTGSRPEWTYLYNTAGFLEYKIDPEQNTIQYVYNPDQSLKETIDPQLQKKAVVFNPSNGITTVTEKDGGQWIYRYDSSRGVLLSKTDPEGNVTSYTYYPDGQTLSETRPGHGENIRYTTFYTYDAEGKTLTESVPVDLSAYSLAPEAITDPAQLASLSPPINTAFRYTYDPNHYGQIKSVTDERGTSPLITSYSYFTDTEGFEVITITDPYGKTSTTRLFPDGRIKEMTDGNGRKVQFEYHSDGQLWWVLDYLGIRTEYLDYDPFGNPRRVKITSNQGEKVIDHTYDNLGRLTATSVMGNTGIPDGNATLYQTIVDYDLNGYHSYLRDAENNETWFENNYKGQITSVTDALLNRTELQYGGAGCSSCGTGADALTAVIDANHSRGPEPRKGTTFSYYQTGKLKSETDALGKTVIYEYYPSGLLHRKLVDVNGNKEADPGDRILLSFTYTIEGQVATKTDHVTGAQTSFTYTPNGRLWTASSADIGYTYDYYPNGWLKSVSDSKGSVIRYEAYDGIGQRDLVKILPGGSTELVLDYHYDAKGRLEHIDSAAGRFTFGYDGWSRRDSLTYPNWVVGRYGYHPDMDWLTSVDYGADIASISYPDYDRVGNRKERNEDGVSTIYDYDDIYQLLSAASPDGTERFTYDPVGNRKSGPTVKDTEFVSYVHDDANRMLKGRKYEYAYDDLGNQRFRYLSADKSRFWEYTWDGDNRLIKAELNNGGTVLRTVSFKYDPFGRRIEKKVVDAAGTVTRTYVYDGEDIVLEYLNDGAPTHYVHGPGIDEPLAMVRGGQPYFFHADGLGSIVAMTDAGRNVVQRYAYESFGMLTPQDPAFENTYTYTGREWDKEIGLYYYRARHYDPMEGRFISRDPIGVWGKEKKKISIEFAVNENNKIIQENLYAYTDNNPIIRTDPDGLWWQGPVGAGIVGVGLYLHKKCMDRCIGENGFCPEDGESRKRYGQCSEYCTTLAGMWLTVLDGGFANTKPRPYPGAISTPATVGAGINDQKK